MTLVAPAWTGSRGGRGTPELVAAFTPEQRGRILIEAQSLLSSYYRLEDPPGSTRRLRAARGRSCPATRCCGFVDRIDVAATGELQVVDYKDRQGAAESQVRRGQALFQMKFYAVALLRSRGDAGAAAADLPGRRGGAGLRSRARRAVALRADPADHLAGHPEYRYPGNFRTTPSRMCNWCAHQSFAPVFGGTPTGISGLAGGSGGLVAGSSARRRGNRHMVIRPNARSPTGRPSMRRP